MNNEKVFSKKCPECNNILYFKYRSSLRYSISKNLLCKDCRSKKLPLTRDCPKCKSLITYKTKGARYIAEKKSTKCHKCAINNPIRIEKFRQKVSGKNNHFYGRHHTDETKEKIRKNTDRSWMQSEKYKEKQRSLSCGERNPMFGKNPYDIWFLKYGKEIADKKLAEWRINQKLNTPKGEKVWQYNKPSPQGSGNGWKGWYKGIYFRSLREVSYMLTLDELNIKWQPAENLFSFKYLDFTNNIKTYRPDFLVEDKRVVEIKPQNLHSSPLVRAKANAAIEYCNKNNLKYELIDVKIESEKIKMALENNLIKFHRDYESRFLAYCDKNQPR